uniref:Ubiquitin-like domain-containing protein n=1 Tax=Panagrellus redivivus TaxID=6233 RepID=A0A7E4VVH2_PANRE
MLDSVVTGVTNFMSSQTLIFFAVMALAMYLAWLSTGVEPLHYRLWVGQLISCPSHQVLRLHDMRRGQRDRNYLRLPPTVSPDSNPRISTVVFVQRPTEVHGPNAPRAQHNYFDDLSGNVEHQQALADFIHEHTEMNSSSQPLECLPDDIDRTTTAAPLDHPAMLMEVIHQLQTLGRGDDSSRTDAAATSSSSASALPGSVPMPVPNPQRPEDFVGPAQTTPRNVVNSMNSAPPAPDSITVALRKSTAEDASADKHIETTLTTTILDFKRQCFPDTDVSKEKLIYQGILLENDTFTVGRYGLRDQSVVLHVSSQTDEPLPEMLLIRLKHLDDRVVESHVPVYTTVGELKRINFHRELANGNIIRLIFRGVLLRNDSKTLSSYGIVDDSVLHVQIGQAPYRAEGAPDNRQSQNSTQNNPNQPFGNSVLIVTGYAPVDAVLLALLSSVLWIVRWSETEDVVDEADSLSARFARRLRHAIRYCAVMAASLVAHDPNNDQESQYHLGNAFYFFICLKVMFLIFISLWFPQIADLKSVFLLSLISCTALLYIWCNRPRQPFQTQ